jgi:hypothetical protein
MLEKNTNTRDANYGYYVVAFIDVLGQKEAFEGILHLPKNEHEMQRLIKADKETAFFVETLRESFEKFFNETTSEKEAIVKVAEKNKEQFDKIRKATMKYRRFSDCIQVFVPLNSEEYHAPCINGVFSILVATGSIMLLSLSAKKPLRVGIDVVIGIELSGGEVYGPGFFNAYKLESKIAKHPRIVLGNEFVNYLGNLICKNPQSAKPVEEDIEACSIVAKMCMNMIIKDTDDHYILNYLGKSFKEYCVEGLPDKEKCEYFGCIEKAKLFVNEEKNRWESKGDAKLASRYSSLCDYFVNKEEKT